MMNRSGSATGCAGGMLREITVRTKRSTVGRNVGARRQTLRQMPDRLLFHRLPRRYRHVLAISPEPRPDDSSIL